MNLLQVVQTNTSTLDTTLPALWHIRQCYPAARITILFCTSSKEQVLRDSDFINTFCKDNNIVQLDLSDLLQGPSVLRRLWRALNGVSPNDAYPLKKLLRNPQLWFTRAVRYVGMAIQRRLASVVERRLLSQGRFDCLLSPDIVLFDLREKSRFSGREYLFALLYRLKPLTFLLPHSPHDIRPNSEITSFDEKGDYFPSFCRYWIPFIHSQASKAIEGRSDAFVTLGYPAFDSRWINNLMRREPPPAKRRLRCLILVRNFYDRGVTPPASEWFTVSYDSVLSTINRVAAAFSHLGLDIDCVIKPHPKASLPRTQELLASSDLKNWSISYESFYSQVPAVDLVIANFTTSLLIPQMCGVPTIVIEDSLQRYVHRWPVLADLYSGLSLYCKEGSDLSATVRRALTAYDPAGDIAHLRSFFPDGNLDDIVTAVTGSPA